MTNKTWLRTSFALLLAGASAAGAIVACDGDDDVVQNNVKDASPLQDGNTPDAITPPPVDSGADAGPPRPKVILVHAANKAGPVRLCLARSTSRTPVIPDDVLGLAPLPYKAETPALPPGFGSVLPIKDLDVPNLNLVPILFSPASLARVGATGQNKLCDEIMRAAVDGGGATPLIENTDYFVLPPVPKDTFKSGNTYVAIATGCPAGIAEAERLNCGPDYGDGTKHNLKLVGYQLDKSSGGAGNLVQFIHGASALQGAGPVVPFINPTGADGGAIALSDDAGVTFAGSLGKAVPIAFTGGIVGVRVVASGGIVPSSVAAAQVLGNGGTPNPAFYAAGRGFTFIAVGDLTQSQPTDGGFNPLAPHFLAFDNDPIVPPLD
jgi:hypothetical protein